MSEEFRSWFFRMGWWMPAILALWFVANEIANTVFHFIRTRHKSHGRFTRFFVIKLDAAQFLVRWGLVLALVLTEAYLILRNLDYFLPHSDRRSAYFASIIGNVKNIGIVLICAITIHRLSRLLTETLLVHATRNGSQEREKEQRLRTLVGVLQGVLTTTVFVAAALLIVWQLDPKRSFAPVLTAGAGIVGIVVAFGAQSLMRDFFAGFFILMENQYKIADLVRIGDRTGTVEHISLRVTTLRDESGTVHIIPNGEVKIVSNMSFG